MPDLTSMNTESREFIVWLFRGRCVICNHPGGEVNEIIPRSRSKNSVKNWKNKVLMCREHHEEYHNKGVGPKAIKDLQERRLVFLVAIGRESYV